jgi:predicted short-subunit dehydrogenase-like oxidoreductase (DUF2520 family)
VGLVGTGRLGASLARALDQAGYRVVALADRNASAARELAEGLSGAQVLSAAEITECSDLVFITVGDALIESLVEQLSWRPGQAVIHCSGALGLDVLEGAAARGARTGRLHPLQSFPSTVGDASRFRNITCGVEGEEPLGSQLEEIARALGARSLRLEGTDHARYHAAAVLASNYVVALLAAARRVWEHSGLPGETAREALAPLLLGSAENAARLPPEQALTGPLARGDGDTVSRHLEALRELPELHELYRRLGRELLDLDLSHDPATRERLRQLLES